jgi:hypothetical protein
MGALDAGAGEVDTRSVADTPTGDTKAQVEDTGRGREGSDRDRRRRGRGQGKSRNEGERSAEPAGEQARGEQGRTEQGRGDQARGEQSRGEQGRGDQARGDRGPGGKPRGKGGGRGRDGRDDRRDRDRDRNRSDQPLTAGLFAGVADREMPCRVAGCKKTWTWYGTQQIRSLGKPEPKRMCDEHLAEFEGIEDRQMPCRNSWCTNTWPWTRAAQLYQRERQDKLKPPHRLCDQCFEEEKTTDDLQIACKIPECKQTWTWARQAQLRHRAWVRRQQAKFDAEDNESVGQAAESGGGADRADVVEAGHEHVEQAERELPEHVDEPEHEHGEHEPEHEPGEHADHEHEDEPGEHEHGEHESADADSTSDDAKPDKRRRRKRRRKRKIHDGPPERLCERCFERANHLEPIEVPCKVHGCTHAWTWEREGQLRAWAALDGRENVTELPQPPRRMCNSCFEFVRAHGDRDVVCGRPGCEKTWMYKTGAQLQDFLAGRSLEPIRLCEDCSRSQFVVPSSRGVRMPAGAEVMPCQVGGCSGSWVYAPGMRLESADPDADEPPVDRMCDDCRAQRGIPGRDPRRMSTTDDDHSHEAEPSEPEPAIENDLDDPN